MVFTLFLRHGLLLGAVVVTALTGCASKDSASIVPQPKNGIAEYQDIVAASQKSLGGALRSLDKVSAQPENCPPKVRTAFAQKVQGLQVESVRVRARSQALLARGEKYFEHWHDNLSRMKDPRVKELARQHRPELQEHFAKLKELSQETGKTFRPFLANLRTLQGMLDEEPGKAGAEATKELIQTTQKDGRQVEQLLAKCGEELKAMTLLLTPAKPSA